MASESSFVFKPSNRLAAFRGGTVWEEFSPLAAKYKAINLGQGFPSFSGPQYIMDSAKNAIDAGHNHYARPAGLVPLVDAISEMYSPYFDRKLNGLTEIVTTNGASEGIYSSIMGLVDPGDEVVMIEPFFDIYNGAIAMANAVPRYVPLHAPEGKIENASEMFIKREELEAAITDKTRMVLVNTPHNPTGKVFSREELTMIAEVVSKYPNIIVLSDEVYEWLTYDETEHVRFATLPGMWDRTITVSSAGKTFSVTGWKTGWVVGPQPLIASVVLAHSYIPFCISTPFQHAIASGLSEANERGYIKEFQASYHKKRDILVQGLRDAGMTPIIPQGTFFILACHEGIEVPEDIGTKVTMTGLYPDRRDWNVCRYLTSEIGVAAIPPSTFYCDDHQKDVLPYVRFAFCKTEEELLEACERLKKLNKKSD